MIIASLILVLLLVLSCWLPEMVPARQNGRYNWAVARAADRKSNQVDARVRVISTHAAITRYFDIARGTSPPLSILLPEPGCSHSKLPRKRKLVTVQPRQDDCLAHPSLVPLR